MFKNLVTGFEHVSELLAVLELILKRVVGDFEGGDEVGSKRGGIFGELGLGGGVGDELYLDLAGTI